MSRQGLGDSLAHDFKAHWRALEATPHSLLISGLSGSNIPMLTWTGVHLIRCIKYYLCLAEINIYTLTSRYRGETVFYADKDEST